MIPFYQQQLNTMIDALLREQLSPSPELALAFKRDRVNAVRKALSMVNLFVPAAGAFPVADTNSTYTVYTKPLNRDVIVVGCAVIAANALTANRISGEFRVRLPEPLEHLSQNYIFPALGFAPATYSIYFPAPFILQAGEQLAVDFGFNAPQGGEDVTTDRQEIVFFCVGIKDCLSSEDLDILDTAQRVIRDTDYQRRVLLNSYTPGSRAVTIINGAQFLSNQDNMIVYTPNNTAGVLTTSITRSADIPLLVAGLGMTPCGSQIRITDTGTGHSFTQGEFIYAHNLYYQEETLINASNCPYYSFFRLPVPHLLKPGAYLFSEHLNGGGGANPLDLNPVFMLWECLTP